MEKGRSRRRRIAMAQQRPFMRISRRMVIKMIKGERDSWRRFGRKVWIPWCWLRNQVPQVVVMDAEGRAVWL
jgi:hypothetical protein